MQERRNEHYADQRGHALRGIAERFRKETSFPPRVFQAEMVYVQRRFTRRIPRSGKS